MLFQNNFCTSQSGNVGHYFCDSFCFREFFAGAILALGVDFSSEHLGGSAGPLLYPVLAFGVCVVVGGMRPHALICFLWR